MTLIMMLHLIFSVGLDANLIRQACSETRVLIKLTPALSGGISPCNGLLDRMIKLGMYLPSSVIETWQDDLN